MEGRGAGALAARYLFGVESGAGAAIALGSGAGLGSGCDFETAQVLELL